MTSGQRLISLFTVTVTDDVPVVSAVKSVRRHDVTIIDVCHIENRIWKEQYKCYNTEQVWIDFFAETGFTS